MPLHNYPSHFSRAIFPAHLTPQFGVFSLSSGLKPELSQSQREFPQVKTNYLLKQIKKNHLVPAGSHFQRTQINFYWGLSWPFCQIWSLEIFFSMGKHFLTSTRVKCSGEMCCFWWSTGRMWNFLGCFQPLLPPHPSDASLGAALSQTPGCRGWEFLDNWNHQQLPQEMLPDASHSKKQ